MAALWCDGFDYLTTADILSRYNNMSGSVSIQASVGRRGSRCIQCGGSSASVTKNLSPNDATAIIGVAFLATAGPDIPVIRILDGSTTQMAIQFNADGSVSILRGSTILDTSASNLFTPGSYHYIELKTTIHSSSGSYEVRLNGNTILADSGVNTQQSSNAQWTGFQLRGTASIFNPNVNRFDDLYVLDGSGLELNDFLGDIRVDAHRPTADGAHSDFTPSTGSDNYAMVDDATPDGDSTYNESDALNAIDTFVVEDLTPTGGSIRFVEITNFAKKSNAGEASIAPVIRYNGTDYSGTSAPLTDSYLYYSQIYEQNPGTGAAWTESDFEATEFGYKKTV